MEYYIYVNLDVLYLVNEMDDLFIVVFRFKWDIIESILFLYISIRNIGIELGIYILMILYIFIFYLEFNNLMLF